MAKLLAQVLSLLLICSLTFTGAAEVGEQSDCPTHVEDLQPEGLALLQVQAGLMKQTKQTLTSGRMEEMFTSAQVDEEEAGQTGQDQRDGMKISCIGDSSDDYPKQLQKMLGRGYTVETFGKLGATLMEPEAVPDEKKLKKHGGMRPKAVPSEKYWYLTTDEYKAAKQSNPDIVVMMLGTNDALQLLEHPVLGEWNESRSEKFTKTYKSLVDDFTSLESHPRVFLMFPPTLIGHQTSLNFKLKELIMQVAAAKQTSTIDPMTAFLKACPNTCPEAACLGNPECTWVHDRSVRPTGEGHKQIAMFVRDAIQKPA